MRLTELFPPNPDQDTKQNTLESWHDDLHAIIDQLLEKQLISAEVHGKTLDSLAVWLHHPDHGANHSHNVYQGMRYIATQENNHTWSAENDSKLQAAAVLHDIMQQLPLVHPKTGEQLPGNQRVVHADTAANAVILFGRHLELSGRDIYELQKSIRDHDLGYFNQVSEKLPYLGKLLSDADKLYGAGYGEPNELVKQAIARNQVGSFHNEGWYLLRDMSAQERMDWQYGDRWSCDGIIAVLKDMLGMPFYTKYGQEIAKLRKQEFVEQAAELYTDRYDETIDHITKWSSQNNSELLLTGKEQTTETATCTSLAELAELIRQTYDRELELPTKYRRLQFSPRGWMIQLPVEEQLFTIDSSVARFAFNNDNFQPEVGRENFKNQINHVIENYRLSQEKDVE